MYTIDDAINWRVKCRYEHEKDLKKKPEIKEVYERLIREETQEIKWFEELKAIKEKSNET